MKIKRWMTRALSASAVAVGLAFSAASHATVLSSYLTFDGPVHGPVATPFGPVAQQGGGEDKLQDDGLAQYVPVAQGQQGYALGDTIWGIIVMTSALASTQPNIAIGASDQVSILFSAEIGNITGNVLSLVPGTGLYSIANLCGALCTNAPNGAGVNADTAAVVLSSTTPRTGGANPLTWATSQVMTNFNNGSWAWEGTMGLLPGTDDFFQFQIDPIVALSGTEKAAFTVQAAAFPVTQWLSVDVQDFAGNFHFSGATLDRGTVEVASVAEVALGWTYRADNTFYVNPFRAVPEPGTLALVGLALAGLGFGRRKPR